MIMADNNVFTRALKIILIISSVFAIMMNFHATAMVTIS
jgi:hypothetical protein